MNRFAIIVAGGSGSRMNAATPKQFLLLSGQPVLMHVLRAFHQFDAGIPISLVLPAAQFDEWKRLCHEHHYTIPHSLINGGETRFHSVKNGLASLKGDGIVAVHDGVRPFVSPELLKNCFETAEKNGSAVPVLPLNESIREKVQDKSKPVDRTRFLTVQTPQCFNLRKLQTAYETAYNDSFTDDASVFEFAGNEIYTVDGSRENIKITWPADLAIAESLIKLR